MHRTSLANAVRSFVALAAVAALIAGCGGSGDAGRLLRSAFSHPIGSANVSVELSATLDGSRGGPFDLRLSGPYRSNGSTKIPSFNWSVAIVGGGHAFNGGLISTGDDLYVTTASAAYDLGAAEVAQTNAELRRGSGGGLARLGIDPRQWISGAHVAGDAEIAGARTRHVRADIDVAKLVAGLARAFAAVPGGIPRPLTRAQVASARSAITDAAVDVYVAKRDGTLRRLAISLAFRIPASDQGRFGGIRSGSVSASVELSAIGTPVSIEPPPNAQPLQASASPQPSPALGAYARCLQRAGADVAAVRRCNALLQAK